jgi:hypothetical protein
MKIAFVIAAAILILFNKKIDKTETKPLPIIGTWQLISGTTIRIRIP